MPRSSPFASAGTARAARDAVRPYVGQLLGLWGSADLGLDMALVALSVAFPAGAAPVTAHLGGWFARSEPPLRTALALALGVHGLAGRAAEQIIWDQVGESVRWVRRSRKFTAYVPSDSPFPKPDQEPYINTLAADGQIIFIGQGRVPAPGRGRCHSRQARISIPHGVYLASSPER